MFRYLSRCYPQQPKNGLPLEIRGSAWDGLQREQGIDVGVKILGKDLPRHTRYPQGQFRVDRIDNSRMSEIADICMGEHRYGAADGLFELFPVNVLHLESCSWVSSSSGLSGFISSSTASTSILRNDSRWMASSYLIASECPAFAFGGDSSRNFSRAVQKLGEG
jgi:hypothetical protein